MADFAVEAASAPARATTYLDRQRRRRHALAALGIFAVGATAAVPLANFTVTALSVVCLLLVPGYFLLHHRGIELIPVVLAALAWISYVASCLVNDVSVLSPNAIAPASFALYLLGLSVLAGRSISAIAILLAGIATGTVVFHLSRGIELSRTGSFADLWKYGIAPAVTVLILFSLIRFGVRQVPLSLALGVVGIVSLVLNYRSHGIVCLVAAAILFSGTVLAPRIGRVWQFVSVAGFGVVVAIVMPLVARAGLLGSALQTKVQQQDANGLPALFASRTEPPLSLTAIGERPLLGWGSPAAMTNQLLIDAEHLAVGLGYSPTIPFETYWRVPGDYSALHSILLGSWAEGGLLAVLLPVWLLAACCALVWNNRRYGRWAPLVVLVGVQGIWDLVYSPWTYNLIPVYVCIALFFAAKHFRHTGDTGSLASTDVPADPALTVSVIVPTVGRATLDRAVRSALAQTRPPIEVIVVADTEGSLVLPVDDRIRVIRTGPRAGASRARQTGIDAARGRVIALLDDDDEWQPNKLRKQLSAASELRGDHWVISSRITVAGSGNRRRVWPRRTIEAGQSIVDYLYRLRDLTVGGAVLQSSTLVFPASLATDIRWDTDPESMHDEAGWLIRVQRAYPDLEVVQLPQALSIYHVGEASLSHSRSDRSGDYVAWGLDYLATEPARVRGDYLCTSPVSAAVSAGSAGGVRRAVAAALRNGRPGPYALAYAALNMLRIWIARLRVPDAREPAA